MTTLLDGPAVERFIAAHEALRTYLRSLDRPGAPAGADALADARVTAAAAALLARHGYPSVEAWTEAVRAVSVAFAFADPSQDVARGEEVMREQMAGVEADPGLSADEKARMIAELEEDLATFVAMRPPRADVEAVRPYVERLRPILAP